MRALSQCVYRMFWIARIAVRLCAHVCGASRQRLLRELAVGHIIQTVLEERCAREWRRASRCEEGREAEGDALQDHRHSRAENDVGQCIFTARGLMYPTAPFV